MNLDSEGQTSHAISYMWNPKKGIQMNVFAEQKQTLKTNLQLPKRTGEGKEGWTGALELAYAH